MYGPFTNERLVGRAIRGRRNGVVLATKFGNERAEDGTYLGVNGRPDYVHKCCDDSLRRLGVSHIDLYYQHRVDRTVPIEETVGAMAAARGAGEGPATWASPRPHPTPSAARSASTRSRRCRPSTRSGPAIPRTRFSRSAASWASASWPTAPLGRGFLTGRFRTSGRPPEDDYRPEHAAIPGRQLPAEPGPGGAGESDRRTARSARRRS